MKKTIISMILALAMVSMISPDAMAKAKPKLSKTKLTINEGSSKTLKVKNTKKKVKWSSSDTDVATVSSKGKVKGIEAGKATIKAKVAGKVLKCKVTVKEVNKPENKEEPSKPAETKFDPVAAKKALKVTIFAQTSDQTIYKVVNTYSLPMCYNFKLMAYTDNKLEKEAWATSADKNPNGPVIHTDNMPDELMIGPGQTRYVNMPLGKIDFTKYTIKGGVVVYPEKDTNYYKVPEQGYCETKYGVVKSDMGVMAICRKANASFHYEFLLVTLFDGVPVHVKTIENTVANKDGIKTVYAPLFNPYSEGYTEQNGTAHSADEFVDESSRKPGQISYVMLPKVYKMAEK